MNKKISVNNFLRTVMVRKNQYYVSFVVIVVTILLCIPLATTENYHTVSYLLLFEVALLATFMEIIPVLIASILSALAWNFFFIPPHYTFQIGKTEDTLVFFMFFIIAMLNGVLTNRIKYLAELAQKANFLHESDKLYKTLFNSISHELRIPVATIMGASESLVISDHDKTIQSELANEIFTASIRLNRVIENLLNMSRLESGRLTIRKDWNDINDLINKVLKDLETDLKYFRIEINIPPDMPLVRIDYGLMEQVMYNLLFNATQHAPAESIIEINIRHKDNNLEIEILDSGPGFPEDKINNVFDKFFRIENSRAGGLGLGLSIVKGFIEAHNGNISVKNRIAGGSCFTIRIPSERPEIDKFHSVFHD